jgi:hypothetical protein
MLVPTHLVSVVGKLSRNQAPQIGSFGQKRSLGQGREAKCCSSRSAAHHCGLSAHQNFDGGGARFGVEVQILPQQPRKGKQLTMNSIQR